jgi:hypothetical protein
VPLKCQSEAVELAGGFRAIVARQFTKREMAIEEFDHQSARLEAATTRRKTNHDLIPQIPRVIWLHLFDYVCEIREQRVHPSMCGKRRNLLHRSGEHVLAIGFGGHESRW